MKFTYKSNNSGDLWPLTDQHWKDLETAGWVVSWFKDDPEYAVNSEGRWLRALAAEASKDFETIQDCVAEWIRITSLDVTDEGCPCCGEPHIFSCEKDYWDGSDFDIGQPQIQKIKINL